MTTWIVVMRLLVLVNGTPAELRVYGGGAPTQHDCVVQASQMAQVYVQRSQVLAVDYWCARGTEA